jgi:hypothetical protein
MMRCRVNLFGGVQLDPVAQLVEQRTFKSAPSVLQAQPTSPHEHEQTVSDATMPHGPAQ